MKYSEAILLWNPGTDEQQSKDVVLVPLGSGLSWSKKYRMSGGAAFIAIRHGNIRENRLRVLVDFVTLTVRDNVEAAAAHEAFCAIKEYRDLLSPDAPMPERWKAVFRQELADETCAE